VVEHEFLFLFTDCKMGEQRPRSGAPST
jgi:hypothetical protein